MLRISILVFVLTCTSYAQAFSSDFNLFSDANIAGTDAGVDGLWGTADDGANTANPLGGVSYIYSSTTGPFSPSSYDAFGVGNFTLDFPGAAGAGTADYSDMFLLGTIPSTTLPFEIGTLSLNNAVSSGLTYAPGSNNMIFSSTLSVLDGPISHDLTGTGYTIYNAAGFDDPSVFGGVFGNASFFNSLSAHFDYLLGIAPESWTAITVDFLTLDGTDISAIVSSYSLDEQLLPAAVPLPPALWLFGTALFGLINCPRKKSV